MREIKFRAWITDYALMTDVNFMNIDYKEIVVMIDENDYEFNCGEYELMQYTGLKDKNGTEIYEGDIVECFVNGNSHVSFKGGAYGLIFDYSFIPFSDVHGEMKVIGNIYEHPHLLGD